MLDGWNISTLGDVILGKPQYGLTAKSSTKGGKILYLRISDITDEGELKTQDFHYINLGASEVGKYRLDDGDFLIARSGSVGRVYLHQELDKASVFASYLIRFRLDTRKVVPKFVFYWGLSPDFKREIEARRKVVAQPNINAKDYCRFKLSIPPLETQRRIVSVMDRLRSIRQKREHANQFANKISQSAYVKRFGDPSKTEKWPKRSLGELCSMIRDGPHKRPKYQSSGVPFLTVHNISESRFLLDDVFYISSEQHAVLKKRVLPQKGDVLYTKGGTTGIAKEVDLDFEFSVYVHLAVLRPKRELINPTFLEVSLNSQFCKEQAARLTRGIANRDLVLGQMRQVVVPTPPLGLQEEFVRFVKRVRILQERQLQSKDEINELFHSLMYKAFSGELRTAEITAEA